MLGTIVYFAHPYCSCEKDCIENQNKLIRQYIPKLPDLKLVDNHLVKLAQYKLNHRPGEKLNFPPPLNVSSKKLSKFVALAI